VDQAMGIPACIWLIYRHHPLFKLYLGVVPQKGVNMAGTFGESAIFFSLVYLLHNARSSALFPCSCLLLLLTLKQRGDRDWSAGDYRLLFGYASARI